jgi:hypothetical protein
MSQFIFENLKFALEINPFEISWGPPDIHVQRVSEISTLLK